MLRVQASLTSSGSPPCCGCYHQRKCDAHLLPKRSIRVFQTPECTSSSLSNRFRLKFRHVSRSIGAFLSSKIRSRLFELWTPGTLKIPTKSTNDLGWWSGLMVWIPGIPLMKGKWVNGDPNKSDLTNLDQLDHIHPLMLQKSRIKNSIPRAQPSLTATAPVRFFLPLLHPPKTDGWRDTQNESK